MVTFFGCKSTLEVEGNFPTPIINQLPFDVGVIYGQTFSSYKYIEANKDRNKWEIGIGKSQVQLFNTVLGAMFKNVVITDKVGDESSTNFDMFIQPNIEEFQYNLPSETEVKMFEVWIKYNMKVYDGQGQLIADWIQTAYGKTPTAFFQTQEKALNEAMVIALRDLGAGLSIRFVRVPEINDWIKEHDKITTNFVKPKKEAKKKETKNNNKNTLLSKRNSKLLPINNKI